MLYLTRLQWLALTGFVAGLATAVMLFALRGVLLGPRLSVFQPSDGAIVPLQPVRINGRALQATSLTLNGAPIPLDVQGFFEAMYDPAPGLNILTLEASDRIERTARVERTLVAPLERAYTLPHGQEGNQLEAGGTGEEPHPSE
jgi:hypothetical protein